MRLLVDTNVFLEVLLAQTKAGEAKELLGKINSHNFFISDYSLHSIGLLLFCRKQPEVFRKFLDDVFVKTGVTMVSLAAGDFAGQIDVAASFNLDFDDAYQYATAEKHGLTVVSFDRDFDRTSARKKDASADFLSHVSAKCRRHRPGQYVPWSFYRTRGSRRRSPGVRHPVTASVSGVRTEGGRGQIGLPNRHRLNAQAPVSDSGSNLLIEVLR